MLIGASAVAVIAITALLVGVITDRAFVIYLSIGTCVVGLLLMVADAWARRRPGPDGPAPAGGHWPGGGSPSPCGRVFRR
ncbi:hypothetical protein [Mycobacterium shinjukuense]|uniref:hypothetical protein n=1 Tax=Mycobacterium shinjukuense TaxID=398694 RepID=UPI0031019181